MGGAGATGTSGARLILANRSVAAVVGIAFVMMLGQGIVLPTLPLYARSFDVGYGAAGVFIAAYGFARLGFDLAAGLIVDRIGERAAGAAGLALVAASSVCTALAPSFAAAAVFWGAVGASSAVVQAANLVHLIKVVPQGLMARTFGIFYGAFNAGLVAGGFAGGFLADRAGLGSPLFASAALATVAAVLYLLLLPALPHGVARPGVGTALGDVRARLRRVLRTRGLTAVLASQLAYLWMFTSVFAMLIPLFGRDELGMSPAAIGVVFAVGLAVELAVLYPAGSMADRRGRKRVLVPAMAALAVLTAAVGFAGTALALGLLVAALSVASGFVGTAPGAMLSDLVAREDAGVAVGIFRFSTDLGWAFGPLAVGFVSGGFGFTGAFVAAAVPAAIAVALLLRTPETLRPAAERVS